MKLLPCPAESSIQPAFEPCHIMHSYKASFRELSPVLPVYPGVEWLCLDNRRTQLHVE
jgi:hypothetical protein